MLQQQYCHATTTRLPRYNNKVAVKAITDGLRIDVAHTKVRVTNVKPGLVETNFSNVRFHGDNQRAASVYQGIEPLNGDDIADVAFYAAKTPMRFFLPASSNTLATWYLAEFLFNSEGILSNNLAALPVLSIFLKSSR